MLHCAFIAAAVALQSVLAHAQPVPADQPCARHAVHAAAQDVQAKRSPAQHSHGYYYFKSWRALAIDESRLAVQPCHSAARGAANAEAFNGVHEALAALGTMGDAEALVIDGWWLAALAWRADAAVADRSAEAAAGALAADERVDFVSPVFVGDDGGPLIVTRDILVQFEPGCDADEAFAALCAAGQIVEVDFGGMAGAFRVRSAARNGFNVLASANALAQRADVRFAEPEMIFTGRGTLVPNDPGFSLCWGLHNTGQSGGLADMDIDAPEAWDMTTGSSSVIVVIIDVGVQQDHPDINQMGGTDTTSEGGNGGPHSACDNHGTVVAGCVSAKINNGLGTVGVAPGCKTASARTMIATAACDLTWTTSSSWTVNSLAWAQSIGARVTNNSNDYGFTSSAITQKYTETRAAGMVHFASSGNSGLSSLAFPASSASVNSVGAINRSGNRPSFSNYGTGLDFTAPGVAIYTTDRTGPDGFGPQDYISLDGTSLASPYAAGVAALLISHLPCLDAAAVEEVMQLTCTDRGAAGYDTFYGYGVPNAYDGMFAAPSPPDPPASVAASDGEYCDRVEISWSAVFGATSYTIYRHTSNNSGQASVIGSASNPSFSDATATPDTAYYYWVTVLSPCGVSGFSNSEIGYRTEPLLPPAAVVANDGTHCGLVQVFWTPSAGASQYQLFRNTSDVSAGAALLTTTGATQFDDQSAAPNRTYWYWVKAIGDCGASDFSMSETGSAACGLGDLNCDGSVNGFDVEPFVQALSDPPSYAVEHSNCDSALADVNGDGSLNGFDIDGFVGLLGG
ncbi:MAG: hypothetical protein CHACPFDD_03949 [Phycisphaerae bacterium]|nr:hypothetical protein [Phycisphaerae bacterium]